MHETEWSDLRGAGGWGMNGRVVVGIVLAGVVAGCSAAAPTSTTELTDSNRRSECRAMPKLGAAACPADGRSALP